MSIRRSGRGSRLLAAPFALFGLNALAQSAMAVLGQSDDPLALSVLQTLVGGAGMAAAVGSWSLKSWAPAAALAYGATTSIMLFALPALLDLEPEARTGIWTGAVGVLLFGVSSAWYLRRRLARRDSSLS